MYSKTTQAITETNNISAVLKPKAVKELTDICGLETAKLKSIIPKISEKELS